MNEVADRGLSRRAIVQGAAWTVPVIALATSAPLAAASGCVETVTQAVAVQGNPAQYTFTPAGGTGSYKLFVSSVVDSGTETSQANAAHGGPFDFNMGVSGSGWNGEGPDDGSGDYPFSGFGENGALTLNQRVKGTTAPASSAAPLQTLTFTFQDPAGATYNPTNFQITVFDISAVNFQDSTPGFSGWRAKYRDSVGFSTPPTSIANGGSALPGIGSGTLADPYRRATDNESTPPTLDFTDTFTFSSFPSGSKMIYTQVGDTQGWQFISIAQIKFDVTVC